MNQAYSKKENEVNQGRKFVGLITRIVFPSLLPTLRNANYVLVLSSLLSASSSPSFIHALLQAPSYVYYFTELLREKEQKKTFLGRNFQRGPCVVNITQGRETTGLNDDASFIQSVTTKCDDEAQEKKFTFIGASANCKLSSVNLSPIEKMLRGTLVTVDPVRENSKAIWSPRPPPP